MNHWNEGFAGQGWPGMCPAEGVADKQQSGGKGPCLQGPFAERLAWERGGDFPLLADFTLEKVCGYAIIYCGLGKKGLIFSI